MDYKETHINGILNSFINYFWKYEHIQKDKEYTILPDACFDLVFDYEKKVLKNIYLTGIWTEPIKVTVTKGTTLYAIRFKIIAAEYLFSRELKTLLNNMVQLPIDYWNISLGKCVDFEKFTDDLSERMLNIIHQQPNMDLRKLKLFELIYSGGYQNVKELSEIIAWSSQQINRYFNKQYGFPLKTFLNIVRCTTSYQDIANGRLYPKKEYTDQAHFIKEVRKYTNNSPRQLLKNENDRFLQLLAFKTK
jgi:AraC-like DNA-binding protein